MEEHGEAVGIPRIGILGLFDQSGGASVVDRVIDQVIAFQEVIWKRRGITLFHSQRGCIHNQVSGFQSL